ncbi:hypothetical protein D1007_44986 [Hordeum vulgare]|nr:hypothetical protein D1007_44986 [Hordeum vulgare]
MDAMADLERRLQHTMVAYAGGARRDVSLRFVLQALQEKLDISADWVSMHAYRPENFLVVFARQDHRNSLGQNPMGKVKDVQVTFSKRNATVDFFIMEPNKGNIVLGRDFLRAMRGFIDVGKGHIRLRGKAKGTYPFPMKNKDELVEDPFEGFYNSDNFGES